MKAALSHGHVAAALDEYQCLRLSLGTWSKSQTRATNQKTIKQSGNLDRLALHFVSKGMEAK
ncbi:MULTISPECIES: hypothetical protein [Marinomonas]|uniref:hypothetical protein n=1 Tax=Marinomonas TaxID=28253 RepID=UPI001054831A|nr:hypothetical protein [Marinomonas sp. KMM3893]